MLFFLVAQLIFFKRTFWGHSRDFAATTERFWTKIHSPRSMNYDTNPNFMLYFSGKFLKSTMHHQVCSPPKNGVTWGPFKWLYYPPKRAPKRMIPCSWNHHHRHHHSVPGRVGSKGHILRDFFLSRDFWAARKYVYIYYINIYIIYMDTSNQKNINKNVEHINIYIVFLIYPTNPGSPSENGFMEPKYLAFRRWLGVQSSSDKVIGSLGLDMKPTLKR